MQPKRAVEPLAFRHPRPTQRDHRLSPRFAAAAPCLRDRRAATAAGAPPKQAKGRLVPSVLVGHLHAVLGHQDTAGGGQKARGPAAMSCALTGRSVTVAMPSPTATRASRYAMEGSGMNRAEAQAVLFQTGRCPAPWLRNTTSVAARSRWLRSIATRYAVTRDRAALGPGDQVGTAIRAGRGVHHTQNRDTVAQQPDGDRTAAPSFQERAGAVMRIDNPAIAVRLGGQNTLFLTDESGRQQRRQTLAQKQFDLGVDRRGVVVAGPRTVGPAELGGKPDPGLLHEVDHGRENRMAGLLSS